MSDARQFSAVAAFRHGVRSVIENIPAAFAMSWPWLLVGGLLSAYPYYIILQSGGLNDPEVSQFAPPRVIFSALFLIAIFTIIFTSIAVNWHRYILLDDWPKGAARVRFDGKVFRYLGNLILITLMAGLVVSIVLMLAAGTFRSALAEAGQVESMIVGEAIAGVLAFFAGGLFFRLALKLPAVALGRTDYKITNSARDTSGNFGQLAALSFLSWLLNTVMQYLGLGLVWASGAVGSNIALALSIAITFFVTWLLGLLGITLLSSLYGFFVENREF
jgi:hypothetical protein